MLTTVSAGNNFETEKWFVNMKALTSFSKTKEKFMITYIISRAEILDKVHVWFLLTNLYLCRFSIDIIFYRSENEYMFV